MTQDQTGRGNRVLFAILAVLLTLGGGAAGWYWQSRQASAVPAGDRAAIEQIVREYILDHPEILPEAMDNLRKRENAKQLSGISAEVMKPFPGAVLGNPDGKVTLVEFTDFACTFCRQSVADVEALIAANPDLKVVIRELPILSPHSVAAARMALAAADQGKYRAFHNAMYAAGQPDEATIAVVKKTLDEIVNQDVCAAISTAKGRPKGMPGDSVLVCQKLTHDDDGREVDLGYVGDVTEVKVKLIKKEIADGFVPVISPVAEGYDGKPYNVNADLVAGRVASALRARRLVYMSDVPGLLADPADQNSLISTLKISQVDDLKKKGVIDKGMRPKVQSAIRALEEGVQRVHFIDGRLAHSLLLEIFTDHGIGTEIVHG